MFTWIRPRKTFNRAVSGSGTGAFTLLSASLESQFFQVGSVSMTGSAEGSFTLRSNLDGEIQDLFSVSSSYGTSSLDGLFYTQRGATLEAFVSGAQTLEVSCSYGYSGLPSSLFGAWPGVVVVASGSSTVNYTIAVDPARFSEQPQCFELGVGGCTMRNAYLALGSTEYIRWTHTQDGVAVNPDPGVTEAALSGSTGIVVNLPEGESTAQEHAILLASSLTSGSGINSAAAAVAANDDGSWNVEVETDGTAIAAGAREWGSRGAAGLHGSHIVRMPRTSEVAGSNTLNITRMVGTRINAPSTDATIWAVQIALGSTVSTGAQRPRLQYWISTSATNPGSNTEAIFDFGQIPAGQMIAGGVATIYLTAAQSTALRAAIDGASGTNHWLSAHSTGGSHYNGVPNGGLFDGETAGGQVRVQADGLQDATVANTDWTSGGSSFSFLVPLRLVYDIDPCTNGETRTGWGSYSPYADFTGDFSLPDTLTGQTGDIEGLRGARHRRVAGGGASGDVRRGVHVGGDTTLDAPSMDGATALFDVGPITNDGTILYTDSPSGSLTTRVPLSGGMWTVFKGQGASGRGEPGAGPFVTGRIDNPSSWVRRFGANIGQNPMERDNGTSVAAGYGDDTTAFETPISSSGETSPGNHPSVRVELFHPAITVAVA